MLLKRLVRAVRARIRRQRPSDPDAEIRRRYQEVCRIGNDSPNAWIRRSAEIPGWLFSGEHEFILQQALAAPPGDFVEIGVLFGKTTSLLCGALEQRGNKEIVFAIDPFTLAGNAHDDRVHRITHGQTCSFALFAQLAIRLGYYHQVIPIATFSTVAVPRLALRIAFVFIDGCHEREAVLKDFELVYPQLVPGALVLFHDAGDKTFPGVDQAIGDVLASHHDIEAVGRSGSVQVLQRSSMHPSGSPPSVIVQMGPIQ